MIEATWMLFEDLVSRPSNMPYMGLLMACDWVLYGIPLGLANQLIIQAGAGSYHSAFLGYPFYGHRISTSKQGHQKKEDRISPRLGACGIADHGWRSSPHLFNGCCVPVSRESADPYSGPSTWCGI